MQYDLLPYSMQVYYLRKYLFDFRICRIIDTRSFQDMHYRFFSIKLWKAINCYVNTERSCATVGPTKEGTREGTRTITI